MNLPKWQGNGKEEGKAALAGGGQGRAREKAAAPRKDLARGKFHGPKASRSRARPEQAQRPMESRRSARRQGKPRCRGAAHRLERRAGKGKRALTEGRRRTFADMVKSWQGNLGFGRRVCMRCPICGCEMEEGGLIVDGVAPGWVPMEQFKRKGLKRLVYTGLRTIGTANVLLGQTKIPNAFFCKGCDKVVGIFDVTNELGDTIER